jgi:hypothetical protein
MFGDSPNSGEFSYVPMPTASDIMAAAIDDLPLN